MKRNVITIFICALIASNTIKAQQILDSLLLERQFKLTGYVDFREDMTERTWLNMVNLTSKAEELIRIDNQLINNYLEKELRKRKELKDSIEKLNLEIALLTKETEVQEMILDEKSFLNKTLLIIIGSISLLFFILLIFYIDRQSRYRAAKLELERLWTIQDDPESNTLQNDELSTLREQLFSTADEVEKLKKEHQVALSQKIAVERRLNKEVTTRKEAEQEIKDLIDQLRKV